MDNNITNTRVAFTYVFISKKLHNHHQKKQKTLEILLHPDLGDTFSYLLDTVNNCRCHPSIFKIPFESIGENKRKLMHWCLWKINCLAEEVQDQYLL